jgi:hypothetical protein
MSSLSSCGGDGRQLTFSRLQEVGASIRQTFEPVIMTHLYPRSEISIHVSVLSADGGESHTGLKWYETNVQVSCQQRSTQQLWRSLLPESHY